MARSAVVQRCKRKSWSTRTKAGYGRVKAIVPPTSLGTVVTTPLLRSADDSLGIHTTKKRDRPRAARAWNMPRPFADSKPHMIGWKELGCANVEQGKTLETRDDTALRGESYPQLHA